MGNKLNIGEDKIELKAAKSGNVKIDLNSLVNLKLKLRNKTLRVSSYVDQTLPLLATLSVGKIKVETLERASIDLICVIDQSGSMEGTKIDLVKKTFDSLFEYLGPNDRVSIITFNDSAVKLCGLRKMSDSNKSSVLNLISGIHAGGGTNIDAGMQIAFETLKSRSIVNSVSSIFLLSDGLDNGAQNRVKQSLENFKIEDTFTIHSFGFGNDHDPLLMTDIATLKDGAFYFVEKLDTVDECFVECLGGMQSAVAKDVELIVEPVKDNNYPGIEITKAYGSASMWTKRSDSYVTKLPVMMIDKSKNYILDVKFPKTKKEFADQEKFVKIASLTVKMTDLSGVKFEKKIDLDVQIANELEDIKIEEDDVDVMKNYYRVRGAEILDDARQFADKGNYDEAQKLLKNFKEELGGCVVKNEEFIINLGKDIDQAIKDTKPIEYQARGKINMLGNMKAQFEECAYQQSANVYANSVQCDMVKNVKAKKGLFSS